MVRIPRRGTHSSGRVVMGHGLSTASAPAKRWHGLPRIQPSTASAGSAPGHNGSEACVSASVSAATLRSVGRQVNWVFGRPVVLAKAAGPNGWRASLALTRWLGPSPRDPAPIVIAAEKGPGLFRVPWSRPATGAGGDPAGPPRYRRVIDFGDRSDPGDARVLAGLARTDPHNHGPSPTTELGMILGRGCWVNSSMTRTATATPSLARPQSGHIPITKASGTRRVVLARHGRNRRVAVACYLGPLP